MAEKQPLNDEQLRVRVPSALKKRIADIESAYGLSEAVITRDAVTAMVAYIEEHGGYRRPVRMVHGLLYPQKIDDGDSLKVAEDRPKKKT